MPRASNWMQDSRWGLTRAEAQNYLPWPAGQAYFDAAQDTVCLLVCEHPLPAHVELLVTQHSQILLRRAALNPFSTQSVSMLGIAPTHVQDMELGHTELQRGSHRPASQTYQGQVPLVYQLHHPAWCHWKNCWRYTKYHLLFSLIKILNSNDPCKDHEMIPLVTVFCLDTDYNSLDTDIQLITYPCKTPSVKPISLQFSGKNVMWVCVKGLTQVQEDGMCRSSLVHWCSHCIIEGH